MICVRVKKKKRKEKKDRAKDISLNQKVRREQSGEKETRADEEGLLRKKTKKTQAKTRVPA